MHANTTRDRLSTKCLFSMDWITRNRLLLFLIPLPLGGNLLFFHGDPFTGESTPKRSLSSSHLTEVASSPGIKQGEIRFSCALGQLEEFLRLAYE